MKCSRAQKLINDYIDNLLESGQVQELKNHLEGCEECRDLLLDMESLVKNAGELHTLEPSEDLWPVIKREALKKNREILTQKKGFFSNFPIYSRGPALAISTLLVIMLLIPVLYYGLPYLRTPVDHGQTASNNFKLAEQQYQYAIEALDRSIESQHVELDPELAAVFRKNLAIIDESILICKKSIAEYPETSEANKLLLICYRKKIELLNEIKDITMQS